MKDEGDSLLPAEEASEAELMRLYAPVYDVVRAIPSGRVMTYGQVADSVTGLSVTARQVGAALRFIPDDVPWQRVVGAGGHLPIAKRSPEAKLRQKKLLTQEGAIFLDRDPDRVDMARSQWLPNSSAPSPAEEQGTLFDAAE